MKRNVVKVHPGDNVIVALTDLKAGEEITFEGKVFVLKSDISAKHKFAERRFEAGEEIIMYGVLVGKAQNVIEEGEWINVFNVKHASADFTVGERSTDWKKPD